MGEPRFKVGELVRLHAVSGLSTVEALRDVSLRNSVLGIYEVAAVLPKDYGEPQYRLRRGDGSPDRVARESQLLSAVRMPQPRA